MKRCSLVLLILLIFAGGLNAQTFINADSDSLVGVGDDFQNLDTTAVFNFRNTIRVNILKANKGLGSYDPKIITVSDTLSFGLPVRMLEGTAPDTPASTFGFLYIKTSDNLLYFLNDAGTEFSLTAGAAGGETNTVSSPSGSGTSYRIIQNKSGVDFPHKNIVEGTNITIDSTSTTITINASGVGSGDSSFVTLAIDSLNNFNNAATTNIAVSDTLILNALTASRLLTLDANKLTANTITGANLNLSISDANAVFESRTLTGGVGISAIGDLSSNRTITFDATEISSLTWGAGSFTTMTFNAGVSDPVFTAFSGALDLTTGVLREGGNDVITAANILDDLSQTSLADPGADRIVFWDDSDTAHEYATFGNGISISVNDISIDHDAANNFIANEHIDHTGVTLTAGTNLNGGGDISANRTFNLDDPITLNRSNFDSLGIETANANFVVLARGVGDILLQDSVSVTGLLNISTLTASRLVASDGSNNLVSTITLSNLNSSVSDATLIADTRTITIAGTSNEITSSAGAQDLSANRTWTIGLSTTIDLGGNTSFEVPNGANPTTDAFGEVAADNDAWAASRGALEHFDGTASTFIVAVLASDAPSANQVPKWNADGTITWENDATGGGGSATADSMATDWSGPTDFDDMFPSSANEFLIDTLGVVAANSDFYILARGVGDILLQDSVSVTGQLNVSNLTASRLVATDGSNNLVSTITGANLNTSISDENAVFESRTLTGGVGISAIGDLSANRTVTLDLDELGTEATIDASTDFIAMVDATDSGSGKILLDNIPNAYVTETSIASGDFISMVDITDSKAGKITFANFESTIAIENIGGVLDDILGGTGIIATGGANTIIGGDATIAIDLTDSFAWTSDHTFARAGVALDFQNTTDATSNQVGIFRGGNRGTPVDNDSTFISYFADTDLPGLQEFARFTYRALDVTNSTKDADLFWSVMVDNTLTRILRVEGAGIDVVGNIAATSFGGITEANLVDKTGAEAITGAWDFGGATSLEVPNGAGGTTVDAAGEITIDTTPFRGSLNFYNGSEEVSIAIPITKTWGIEDPVANDSTLTAIRFPFATTIDSVICVLTSAGGASTDTITINFKHGTDRSLLGPGGSGIALFSSDQTVNNNTTGNAFSTFNDATVTTNTWIAPYVVTQGGTVSEWIAVVYLTKDP